MSAIRQIGINVLTQWGAFGLRAGIGIFLVPFLIATLGREYFGVAMLMGVIVAFSGVADLGLRAALGRHLSESLAQNDQQRFSRLASTAGLFWLAIGSVCGVVLFCLAPYLVGLLGITESLAPETVQLLRTFGVASLFLAFTQPLFSAIISCHNRFDLISRTEALAAVVTGLGLFVALGPGGKGIFAWALVTIGVRIGVFAIFASIAFRLNPVLVLSPRLASLATFRELFSLGWQLFFLQLTNLLSSKADPLILAKFIGPQSLALYTPGLTMTEKIRPLVMVLADQLYPVTTKYSTLGRKAEMEKVLFLGTRVTFSMAIGAFVLLGVFSQSIARVWLEGTLGPDYRVAGYILLGWTLVDLFQGAAGSQWAVLIAKNRIKFIVYTQFPLAILNIAASIYLVGFTSVGIIGVIIPTIIIGGIRRILTTFYVKQVFELRGWVYFREAYLRPFLLLAVMLPISVPMAYYFPAQSIVDLMLSVGVTSGIWLILFFIISLRIEETKMLLSKFRSRIIRQDIVHETPSS